MRLLLLAAVLTGCLGGRTRPAVINKLSELPVEAERRDGVLDSAHAEPTPEQHKPLSPKARKIEMAAATAAAWIGVLMSKTGNVTMGGSVTLDPQTTRKRPARSDEAADDKTPAPQGEAPVEPVPWLRLK